MEFKGCLAEKFCLGEVNACVKKYTKLIIYTSILISMLKKISKVFQICSWALMLPSQKYENNL